MHLTQHERRQIAPPDWPSVARERGIPRARYRDRIADGMDPERAATQQRCNRWDGVESDAAVCREYGLNKMAIYHWRHRHPQSGDLPAREIAEIIAKHKAAGYGSGKRN